ncbi:hypothetical protein K505DRAFT_110671 [Melanomma pulvis-pyrius CBS 109.77]|uniref:Uncharacterized protein n=1 Tax=Melanomma pulvis-pyrius CBS 109.77 TaxID=1314802 RepID=A0A6A6XP56_9PLEO|nr:hypothetical protein K505DRAFT_110671 [Melanomma pulvis-pyrius CBS 109.77]
MAQKMAEVVAFSAAFLWHGQWHSYSPVHGIQCELGPSRASPSLHHSITTLAAMAGQSNESSCIQLLCMCVCVCVCVSRVLTNDGTF